MSDPLAFLAGGGEATRLIRERDWTGHPLGAPETWPPELRTALSLVLNSPESMILAWGRDLIFFFNETYFPLLGPRLPWAMGERFDKVWADGWDQAKPIIDDAFAGRSTRFNDLPWTLDTDRGDAMTWWSFSYSRILDADGQIAGLFILTNETTERVKAERRQRDFEDALRAERDRAHDVLDNMGEAFALLGRDMTIADINAEGLRMDGRGPDEIVGRPYREAYPDADPVLEAAYRKALSDGKPFTMEHAAPAGDGRITWIDIRAYPVGDGLALFYRDITARVAQQERLRASEALARENADRIQIALSAGAIIGTWFWDLSADRFTVDEGFARSFGLDPALGRTGLSLAQVIDTVHPDDKPALAEAIEEAIARGGSYAHQYRVRRADGNYYWLEANGRVDCAPDGRPLAFPGVLIDLDERRTLVQERDRVRAALREQAFEFEVLADNIPILCWMSRADGHVHWCSRRWYDYTGAEPGSLLGWGWTIAHDPAILPEVLSRWNRSLATGEPFEMTFPLRGRDGTFRPFLTRMVPIRNADGSIERWFATNTDVAELRAAEQALRDLNATLEQQVAERTAERDQIWKASTDLLCVANFEGYIVSLNPAWAATLGWSAEELTARPFLDFVHPDDKETTRNAARGLARGAVQLAFENRYSHRDGSYRWLSWNAVSKDGKIYSTVRDVTVMKEQAEALANAEDALRQAQKMEAVGQLTGGVAHDFNNLLTIIRSSVDFLRRPNLPEERRVRYMDAMSETVDRAAKLTGQLLAFARRQALKPEVFDVGARLDEVADMLNSVTGARIQVRTEQPDSRCYVRADASQFETALVNMAVNARDAMRGEGEMVIRIGRGQYLPAIRGHAGAPGPFVAVSVVDEGCGIPQEHLSRIFEPFFTTKEVGRGTGLGLSQVIGFAKQSGGDVDVTSALGQGTVFTLYLPEAEASAHPQPEGVADAPEPEDRSLCVLVVEDNLEVGRFCTQILEDFGHSTVWAHNAEEALEEIERVPFRFEAVFSDVVMPGMGGIELAKRLRASHPDLPVILTSGYSDVLAREDDHGFDLVRKPYSAEQVAGAFRKVALSGRLRRRGPG
ncbi:MAG: PAS domain-containing protein [Methylobacterium sp.]